MEKGEGKQPSLTFNSKANPLCAAGGANRGTRHEGQAEGEGARLCVFWLEAASQGRFPGGSLSSST